MSLTAPERETVITFADDDDTATIHTHHHEASQQPVSDSG